MGEMLNFVATSNLSTIIFVVGAVMFIIAAVKLEGKVDVTPIMRLILGFFGLFLMGISFASSISSGAQKNVVSTVIVEVTSTVIELTPEAVSPTDKTDTEPMITSTMQPSIQPTSTDETIQSVFTVQANEPWQDTGLSVNSGDFLQITYETGEWTGQSSAPGYSGPDFGSAPDNTDVCFPIKGEGSSLIGKIGVGEPFKIGYQYMSNIQNIIWLVPLHDCPPGEKSILSQKNIESFSENVS